jgi:hypothetical protein
MSNINLDNSDKRLLEGLVRLLRDKVDGWSTNSDYGVDNVWSKSPPTSVDDEFPRGIVDIISGEDTELSVDLGIKLRETVVRVVVFSNSSGDVFDLTDSADNMIPEHWDSFDGDGNPYTGDWTFREVDGFAETNESGEEEGTLRYSRYKDFVFETVRVN